MKAHSIISFLYFISYFFFATEVFAGSNSILNTYTVAQLAQEDVEVPLHGDCLPPTVGAAPDVAYYAMKSLTVQTGSLTICGASTGNLYLKVWGTVTVRAGASIDLSGQGDGAGLPLWAMNASYLGQSPGSPTDPVYIGQAGGAGGAAGGVFGGGATAGSAGGTGGNGGLSFAVGSDGLSGGTGGIGGSSNCEFDITGFDDDCLESAGNATAGSAGAAGLAGNPGAVLYIEAKTIIVEAGGFISTDGSAGNPGGMGGIGGDGSTQGTCVGGGGGQISAGGTAGTLGGTVGAVGAGGSGGHELVTDETDTCASNGGAGIGSGGGGGGGGGGGLVFLKAVTLTNNGYVSARGGDGGMGGNQLIMNSGRATISGVTYNLIAATVGVAGGIGADGINFGSTDHVRQAGAGGGAGGSGGGGGKGYDGNIVVVYINGIMPADSAGILYTKANPRILSPNLPPLLGNFNLYTQPSTGIAIDVLKENVDVISGWINFYGVQKVSSGVIPAWFQFDNIRVDNSVSDERFQTFDIEAVRYYINSACGGTYSQAVPPIATPYPDPLPSDPFMLDENNFFYLWREGAALQPSFSYFSASNVYRFNSATGPIVNNNKIDLFGLCDGVNQIFLEAITQTGLTNAQGTKTRPLLIDQYAPCDDKSALHHCSLTFHDQTGADIGIGSNSGQVNLRFNVIEGGGSGLVSDGSGAEPNIKIFVVKQVENAGGSFFELMNSGVTANVPFAFDATTTKDLTCTDAINGNLWGASVSPWFSGVYNGIGSGNFDVLLDLSNTVKYGEGSFWVFACLKDRAGNWSLLIDKDNTALFTPASPPVNWQGGTNVVSLSVFNPFDFSNGNNYAATDTTRTKSVLIPHLFKRLFIDKGDSPDDACGQDPCAARVLVPQPAYSDAGESALQVAYSPNYWTNSQKVIVGIKLPFDKSGIKGVNYSIGSSGPLLVQKDLNFVPRDALSLSRCQAVVDNNNQADPGNFRVFEGTSTATSVNWVDFCFEVTPQLNSNIYIWLTDNAGNSSFANGQIFSRKFLVDITPPAPPVSLITNNNPTLSFNPTLGWEASVDDSGMEDYIVCYWQRFSGFTQTDMNNLNKGTCPQSSQIGNGVAFTSAPVLSTGLTEFFQVPGPASLSLGVWSFSVLGRDRAGNFSAASQIYDIAVSDGSSFLDLRLRMMIIQPEGFHLHLEQPGCIPLRLDILIAKIVPL